MFVTFLYICFPIQQYDGTSFVSLVYNDFMLVFKPLYKAHSISWKVRPTYGGLDLRKG